MYILSTDRRSNIILLFFSLFSFILFVSPLHSNFGPGQKLEFISYAEIS